MTFNTATPPAGWVTIAQFSGPDGNLFLDGSPITFALSGSAAVSYEVLDYYGTMVASGACSGTSLTLPALPLGWYKLYLAQSGADANYGSLIGSWCFSVIASDSRLPSPPLLSDNPTQNAAFGNYSASYADHAMRGVALLGPHRFSIDNANAPTTGTFTIGQTLIDRGWYDQWYTNFQPDSARPRPALLEFPNGGYQDGTYTAGVTEVVETVYPGIQYFEGPINEPNLRAGLAGWLTACQTFHDAVKAGNASAKVLGPGCVTINGEMIAAWDAFFAAGGATHFDALSFHFYNCGNGDITLGRKTLDAFMAVLTAHGLEGMELWMTEMGSLACDNGQFAPRSQARNWLIQRFLLDQYGVPKERDYYFYDCSHGFWDDASFWKFDAQTYPDVTPMIPLTRVYSQQLYGKTWQSALDFGAVENDHYLGSVFADNADNEVLAVIGGGRTDGSFTLQVTGAPAVTVVGPFGTESTQACDAHGLVTIPVGLEPVYVQLPAGVTATLIPAEYGANIATWGITAEAGAGTDTALIFNGVLENDFYLDDQGNQQDPPFIDTQTLPAQVMCPMTRPQRIDTVVVYCSNPQQAETSLTDYDLDYQDVNGTWHTIDTVTEPTNVLPCRGLSSGTWALVDCFYSTRSIFVHNFPPIVAAAIRLNVRATTVGQAATQAVVDAQGFGWPEVISLREIQLFCKDTQTLRVLGPGSA